MNSQLPRPTWVQVLEVFQQIQRTKASMSSIRENMAYAEGQAYYRDKARYDELQKEVIRLERMYDALTGKVRETKQPTAAELNKIRENVNKIKAANAEQKAQEEIELKKLMEEEQAKRSADYVNRFKRNRPKSRGNYRRQYFQKLGYAQAQSLKVEHSDMRWDPYIQRWYLSVYVFSGQQYDYSGIKELLLDAEKNSKALEWSTKIKDEQKLPENKRELTYKIHGTFAPDCLRNK